MGIILDTNCFSPVFNRNDKKHGEFKHVLDYLIKKRGWCVYGGSKYLKELGKCTKYLKIFRFLRDIKKVEIVDKKQVDCKEKEIKNKIKSIDFNDQHLAAIVIVSRCSIICTTDTSSIDFLKNKSIYPNDILIPKFYTRERNKNLLDDDINNDNGHKLKKKECDNVLEMIDNLL